MILPISGSLLAADRRDRLNISLAADRLGECIDAKLTTSSTPVAHPANERVGVDAGGDVRRPSLKSRLGQDGGGRGAVARVVGGLAGGLLDEHDAEVLRLVAELDLLGARIMSKTGTTPSEPLTRGLSRLALTVTLAGAAYLLPRRSACEGDGLGVNIE